MKKIYAIGILAVMISLTLAFFAMADSPPPEDSRKHTDAGKYATALEAYEMWKASPEKVKIIDCRTQEEYAFIGHAPMAYNIPSKFWTGTWDAEKKDYSLKDNTDFEAQIKKKFSTSDTLLIMCRSGHRSAASVNRLVKAGFTNVYNVTDGFEGDTLQDKESYHNGKRIKNGWKNSGAVWTYSMDSRLIFQQ